MAFWNSIKKDQSPVTVLERAYYQLTKGQVGNKLVYYYQNRDAILSALQSFIPQEEVAPQSPAEDNQDEETSLSLGRFMLHTGYLFDALDNSPAAEIFLINNQENMRKVFGKLSAIDPLMAFSNALPANYYEDDFVEVLPTLAADNNPELYFECLNEICYIDSAQINFDAFLKRVAQTTQQALENMLLKDSSSLLSKYGYEGYFSYLPDDKSCSKFITEHAQEMVDSYRFLKDGQQPWPGTSIFEFDPIECDVLSSLDEKISCFPSGDAPSELINLRDELYAERVRKCFGLAAQQRDGSNLLRVVESVAYRNCSPTEYMHIGSSLAHNLCTVIKIPNPDCDEQAEDSDAGENSKNLWVLVKDYDVLAAAFSASAMHTYLATQRAYDPASDLLTTEEFEKFSGYKPNSPA